MLMRKMKANMMRNATKKNKKNYLLCLIIKILKMSVQRRLRARGGVV